MFVRGEFFINSMFVILQYILTDLRTFLDGDNYKLSSPTWPIPEFYKEFVRNFGVVENRYLGGILEWPGETAYSRAQNCIRYAKLENQFISSLNTTPKGVFRRLFCDGEAVVRLEIGLNFNTYNLKNNDDSELIKILDEILNIKINIKTANQEFRESNLSNINKYFANAYSSATTRIVAGIQNFHKNHYKISGYPLIIVEGSRGEITDWCKKLLVKGVEVEVFENLYFKIVHFWIKRKNALFRVWLIVNPYNYSISDEKKFYIDWVRKLRLHILRLNAEQTTLKNVIRAINKEEIIINRGTESSERLQLYLNNATRNIFREKRHGIIQDEILKGLIQFENIVNFDERENLYKKIEMVRKSVKVKIINFVDKYSAEEQALNELSKTKNNHIELKNYFIQFNQETIMGDVFKNISGSTIYNKAIFSNAFNKVENQLGNDVANSLSVVGDIISKSNNTEAVELFNAFNNEIVKEKADKGVLKKIWDNIVIAVPVLASTAGIVEKIAKLFT